MGLSVGELVVGGLVGATLVGDTLGSPVGNFVGAGDLERRRLVVVWGVGGDESIDAASWELRPVGSAVSLDEVGGVVS